MLHSRPSLLLNLFYLAAISHTLQPMNPANNTTILVCCLWRLIHFGKFCSSFGFILCQTKCLFLFFLCCKLHSFIGKTLFLFRRFGQGIFQCQEFTRNFVWSERGYKFQGRPWIGRGFNDIGKTKGSAINQFDSHNITLGPCKFHYFDTGYTILKYLFKFRNSDAWNGECGSGGEEKRCRHARSSWHKRASRTM